MSERVGVSTYRCPECGLTFTTDEPSSHTCATVLETFNQFAVTGHEGRVVIMARISNMMEPDDALRLAAWLIVGAELARFPERRRGDSLERVADLVRRIEAT